MSLKFASILSISLATSALLTPSHAQNFFGWFNQEGAQSATVQPGFPERQVAPFAVVPQRTTHPGQLGIAAHYLQQGNYAKATEAYARAVASGNELAPLGLAVALAYRGSLDNAKKLLANHQFQDPAIATVAQVFLERLDTPATPNITIEPPENAGFLRIGVLLPQSGALSNIGDHLVQAAQLSIYELNQPQIVLQFEDAGSTDREARQAAERLLQLGVEVILGPLTADQTKAVDGIARRANVPVLSLSNNPSAKRSGVSLLGHQPTEEVNALLSYSANSGSQTVAALVPANDIGTKMAQQIQTQALGLGMEVQRIITYPPTQQDISDQLKQLIQADTAAQALAEEQALLEAEYAQLGGAMDDAQLARLQQLRTEEVQGVIDFDSLILAIPASQLELRLAQLDFYDVNSTTTQLLVPSVLGLAEQGGGVIYPSIAPEQVKGFEDAYKAAYDAAPPALTQLVYNTIQHLSKALAQANFDPQQAMLLATMGTVENSPLQLHNGEAKRRYSIVQAKGRNLTVLQQSLANLPAIPDMLLYQN